MYEFINAILKRDSGLNVTLHILDNMNINMNIMNMKVNYVIGIVMPSTAVSARLHIYMLSGILRRCTKQGP